MARVLIAEQEGISTNSLRSLISNTGHQVLGADDNSESFLRTLHATQPDVLLIDIDIKGSMDGIEVVKRLQEAGKCLPIIFITNSSDNTLFERAKSVNPFAYIVRPYIESDLQRTIELAHQFNSVFSEKMDNPQELNPKKILSRDNFFIKSGDRLEKIRIDDIAYILIEDRHLVIRTADKKYVVRMALKDILDKLPLEHFAQVHRNYVININHIQHIDTKSSEILVMGQSILVSKRHKDYLMENLNILF